jgi:recombination protein RecR
MNTVDKLTEIFKAFPGIGPRQAKRFVYFLLNRNKGYITDLSDLIKKLPNEIEICSSCFRYFTKKPTAEKLCDICQSKNRDESSLMIVARDIDLENIEKSRYFNGKYFVLGGTILILDKEPANKIRLNELLLTLEKRGNLGLKEIILGFSINPESEYTADFIVKEITPIINKYKIKISHLGRGLSTGTELEYSDADTIKSALENRK